jgi:hypothetical protein
MIETTEVGTMPANAVQQREPRRAASPSRPARGRDWAEYNELSARIDRGLDELEARTRRLLAAHGLDPTPPVGAPPRG